MQRPRHESDCQASPAARIADEDEENPHFLRSSSQQWIRIGVANMPWTLREAAPRARVVGYFWGFLLLLESAEHCKCVVTVRGLGEMRAFTWTRGWTTHFCAA